ncbi:hypothetical protein Vadar_019277 [Vaccinium darrowii]|uniref:Uncharacterized protein n=1 Tax=Vaccinium darrowii TaxID=229202 RepID=A0ACB7ZKE6_9ERIC|nr:hypothetical protein Vadar_019277 [Vaccinium darrowii]
MAEDAASNENEVEQPVPLQLPIVGDADRVLAALAQFTERQAEFMMWQNAREMTRDSGTGLLERFKKLFTVEFERTVSPGDAEEWLKAVERVLDAMELIAPLPGVKPAVPQVVTWERFVKGFNDQYCPESYRMEQEAAFIRLEQGTMTVPEYEAKFAALSRYALEMVDTDAKRCRRFRLGLNPNVLKELVIFQERDYADLVEMARKAEKSLRDCRDKSEFNKRSKTKGAAFGKFGGGNSKGGQQRAVQCSRVPAPAASSVGSVQGGRGGGAGGSLAPGRVYAITRQGAQASPNVVTDKPGRVLNTALAISTPVGDVVVINVCYANCELVVGGRSLLVDLLPLDMTDFDIILGMDFLSGYHAVMDCFSKEVVFQLPNGDEVKFCGDSVVSSTELKQMGVELSFGSSGALLARFSVRPLFLDQIRDGQRQDPHLEEIRQRVLKGELPEFSVRDDGMINIREREREDVRKRGERRKGSKKKKEEEKGKKLGKNLIKGKEPVVREVPKP